MVELFGTLYLNEGLEMEAAVERAMGIFSTLDVNNDGDVTEEEFVRGCLEVSYTIITKFNGRTSYSIFILLEFKTSNAENDSLFELLI